MQSIIRKPFFDGKEVKLVNIPLEQIQVDAYSILSIDGSTSNTGIAIMRESDGGLMYSMSFKRDDKGETPVQYKVRLKREVHKILSRSRLIEKVYYEEPCVDHFTAIANIYMLRTFVEEIIVENEPAYDYIKHYEINNKRWKKLFLAPDKCPVGTDKEKLAVRKKLEGYMPFLSTVTQDEIDAISMGYVVCTSLKEGMTSEDLESRKKARPFKYDIDFIGADDDDGMLSLLYDVYSGPKSILENGILLSEITRKNDFDKHVYSQMGNDDKLLIIKFSSKLHGNIILKYNIGSLAARNDYLYALVWRSTRKN